MERDTSTALIFPGQGLPTKDILACYLKLNEINAKLVEQRVGLTQEAISRVHGTSAFNILSIIRDEASPDFKKTSFVQPIVYMLSMLTSEIANIKGVGRINPSFVAGHSLGEYSALTRARVISFEDGVNIVTARGRFMEETCQKTSSVLVSINGLTEKEVRGICQQENTTIAEVALINAPSLIVVGCLSKMSSDIERLAKNAGARRTNILQTAGAFHTSLMQEAAVNLDAELSGNQFKDPNIPVIPNLTGKPSNRGIALRHHLIESMVNPVKWSETLAKMQSLGVRNFGEVGPGTSLAVLNRINGISESQTINVLSRLS